MKGPKLLWIVLGSGIAVWVALQLAGGPEREIHRRLDALAELLEKDGPEGDLVAVARGRELAGFFAEGFRIRAPQVGGELTDPRRLVQTYLGYRRRFDAIGVAFRDRELELLEGTGTAEVGCVAVLSGRRDGSPSRDRYRLRLAWRKEGGEWKLTDVELVEVLEGGLGF